MAERTETTMPYAALCKDLGLKRPDLEAYGYYDYFEGGDSYGYFLKEAEKEGMTEAAAETYAQEKSDEVDEEAAENYYDAILDCTEEAITTYLGYIDATFSLVSKKPLNGFSVVRIKPNTSWKKTCELLIEIINGVGYFHFDSVRDLCNSIPDTVVGAAMSHLHWLKSYGAVYGEESPAHMVERELDRKSRYM